MLKTALVFCFCGALTVSSAYAGLLDPVPLIESMSQSPPEEIASLGTKTQFFCPLFKNFYNDRDRIAVQTILLEAVGQGYEGMVAVGEVIRNREKLFKKKSEEICLMPKQFSSWNDRTRAKEFLKKHRYYYFIAAAAWVRSERSSLTNGATDYHTVSTHPYWANVYHVAARVKDHIFYVRNQPRV